MQPEVGVSLEAVRAGKVPSSTLQTFKFEDDRGAAGGAAADEVERKVRPHLHARGGEVLHPCVSAA